MKNSPVSDINSMTNIVVGQSKQRLQDRKTWVFILVVGINVFLWGLMLAEYRQVNKELESSENERNYLETRISILEKKLK